MKGNICDCLKIDRVEFESKKMRFEFRMHKQWERDRDYNNAIPFGVHYNTELTFENARTFMRGAACMARKFYKHPTIVLWLVDGDKVRFIDAQQ